MAIETTVREVMYFARTCGGLHVLSGRPFGLVSLMNPLLANVVDFIHCAHCKTHINNLQHVLTYITTSGLLCTDRKKGFVYKQTNSC